MTTSSVRDKPGVCLTIWKEHRAFHMSNLDHNLSDTAGANQEAASDIDINSMLGWFQDAVNNLCAGNDECFRVVEGNAQVQVGVGERLEVVGTSAVIMRDGGLVKLAGHASGTVENGAMIGTERSNLLAKGTAQVFLRGNATGELYGNEVYGFADGHSTAVARGAKLIAAGRATVNVEGGWVGVKDEAVAHVKDGNAEVVGHGIVIAEGLTTVSARGGTVLVSDRDVKVHIKSADALISSY